MFASRIFFCPVQEPAFTVNKSQYRYYYFLSGRIFRYAWGVQGIVLEAANLSSFVLREQLKLSK